MNNKREARIITITSPNGGSGKTTTSLYLVRTLAASGHKILLVDTTTHTACGNIIDALGIETKGNPPTLTEFVMRSDVPSIIEMTDNFEIIGGGYKLQTLVSRYHRYAERNPGHVGGIHEEDRSFMTLLAEIFPPLAVHYDYIIFDTSPGWTDLTKAALSYAEEIIIAVNLENRDVETFQTFLQLYLGHIFINRLNQPIKVHVLPTHFNIHSVRGRTNYDLLYKLVEEEKAKPDTRYFFNWLRTMELCEVIREEPGFRPKQSWTDEVGVTGGGEDYERFAEYINNYPVVESEPKIKAKAQVKSQS